MYGNSVQMSNEDGRTSAQRTQSLLVRVDMGIVRDPLLIDAMRMLRSALEVWRV
jgi:hypothetical protein